MKKIFIFFLFIIVVFSAFSIDKVDVSKFTYINKKIGIGIIFPNNWGVYTTKKNSHEYFKPYFKEGKDKNESPLFYGMQDNMQAFTVCQFEKASMNITDYFKLLYALQTNKKASFKEAFLNEEKETITCVYDIVFNNLNLTYKEIITKNNGYFIRLTFWTLNNFHLSNIGVYSEIEKNCYFFENNKWIKKWGNLESNLKKIDNVEIKEDKKDFSNKFEKDDKAIFYSLKGLKNKVYLLGSIHVGHSDFYPLPEKIENAYNTSSNIVFEVNLNSEENKAKAANIIKTAVLPENKTIDMVISKELYEKLVEQIKSMGLTVDKVKNYKPNFIASMLTVVESMKIGYLEKYGVDKYFLEKADKDKKNILELESFDEQIKLFSEKIDPEFFLNYTLLTLKIYNIILKEIVTDWKKGDEKALANILFNSTPDINTENFNEIMFTSRNIKISEKIKEYLKDDKDYFVVVGAGHLVGDKSIIAILKNAGYEIQ